VPLRLERGQVRCGRVAGGKQRALRWRGGQRRVVRHAEADLTAANERGLALLPACEGGYFLGFPFLRV
jgi:hypothetical protein